MHPRASVGVGSVIICVEKIMEQVLLAQDSQLQ